jgi:hypothetical protein
VHRLHLIVLQKYQWVYCLFLPACENLKEAKPVYVLQLQALPNRVLRVFAQKQSMAVRKLSERK